MFDQENGVSYLILGQFNVYATQTNSMIQMLNDIWSNLVNEVEASKKHYEELEAAMTTTNDRLNDGISALDVRLDRLEDRFRVIRNVQDDVRTTVNKQQRTIYDMDKRISFYSGSIVQLEGKKAEEVKACFDALEQHVAGQDDQINVLLHRLAATEEGRCRCRKSSPKVISCRCFDVIAKLTEDVQEATIEPETGELVRTRSDTIPINPDPEPYRLISQPHLNLAIPFPVSPLRIRSSHLVSLWSGLCSTFPLSSASDFSLVVISDPLRTLVGLSPLCSLVT